MSESVTANESFACEFGMIHQGSEWREDAPVVKAFPQFFDRVTAEPVAAAAPVKRAPGRPRKAAPRG